MIRPTKVVACVQVALQLLLPVATSLNSVILHAETKTPAIHSTNSLTMPESVPCNVFCNAAVTTATSANVANSASSMVQSYAANSVEHWLSQFGTARVQLNVDENGNWDDSAIDFLAPLYSDRQAMLFTQLGLRAPDGRTTGNFGLGVRTFSDNNWMYGANIFLDDDFSQQNRRAGIGAEAWANNLKLSANTYMGTTSWHDSSELNGYEEKPADGFDIRLEGYLPSWPQLGARTMYEQYYGDNVALFDSDHLQSNPRAVTVGVSYTPFPLLTAGVDYKRGDDSLDETKFSLNFRYALGQSWQSQISPDQVAFQRSLAGSRYDLVERNNEIVMQYRKKNTTSPLGALALSADKNDSPADGVSSNRLTVMATTLDGQPAGHTPVAWRVSGHGQLNQSATVTDDHGLSSVELTDKTAEQVTVYASSGNIQSSINSGFTQSVGSIHLALKKDGSQADGVSQNTAQVQVKDANGTVMTGMAVSWKLSNGATFTQNDNKTDSDGFATANFVSNTPGEVKITATVLDKSATTASHFSADAVAVIKLSATKDKSPADAKSTDEVKALLTDASGKPMQGVTVNWSVNGHAKMDSAVSSSDANGEAWLKITDGTVETVSVTASAQGQNSSTNVLFVPRTVGTVAVKMISNSAAADGVSQNEAQATVIDSTGQPMSNTAVSWSASGNALAHQSSSYTDSSGLAKMQFTDTSVETVSILGEVNSKSGSANASFTTVPVAGLNISMANNDAPADGVSTDTGRVVVSDKNGHPMAGVTVDWNVSGSAKLKNATSTTDVDGLASVSLTDTIAENVTLNATAGSQHASTDAMFSKAPVSNVGVTVKQNGAAADGISQDTLQALVTDTTGKPMSNVIVNWTASGNAHLTGASSQTNSAGVATVALTDTSVEMVTVTAAADGHTGTGAVNFTAVQVNDINMTITRNNNPADGASQNSAKVVLTDKNGHPIPGMVVNWSVTGDATLSSASGITDTSGMALVQVTDTVEETVTLSASAGGKTASDELSFSRVPVGTINVAATQDNAPADGVNHNSVTATVLDQIGRPMKGVSVAWSVSGGAVIQNVSAVTDDQGKSTAQIVDHVVEAVMVTATGEGQSGSTNVTFTKVAVADITLAVTQDNAYADGVTQNTAKVLVLDSNGNPMPDTIVNWKTTGSAVLSSDTTSTDVSGESVITLTDNQVEKTTLTASSDGHSVQEELSFTALPVGKVTLTTITDNAPADGTDQIQAVVTDTAGKPMMGAAIQWSASGSAQIKSSDAVTDANGKASVFLTDSAAESVTVTASSGGVDGSTTANFKGVSVKKLVLVVVKNHAPADGSTEDVLQATLTDDNDQPVQGAVIDWTTYGHAMVSGHPGDGITDADGRAYFRLVDNTAETSQVKAKFTGSITVSDEVDYTFDPVK